MRPTTVAISADWIKHESALPPRFGRIEFSTIMTGPGSQAASRSDVRCRPPFSDIASNATIYDKIGMLIPPEHLRTPLEKTCRGTARVGTDPHCEGMAPSSQDFLQLNPGGANYEQKDIAEQGRVPGSIHRNYRQLTADGNSGRSYAMFTFCPPNPLFFLASGCELSMHHGLVGLGRLSGSTPLLARASSIQTPTASLSECTYRSALALGCTS
jgi:hypothetical protein